MAKKSKVAADRRRRRVVERYVERRAELKRQVVDPSATPEQRFRAVRALASLPRDSSPVRLRNRDQVDGRPRGYLRKAGVSRIRFRELAHRGELPGIQKSSW